MGRKMTTEEPKEALRGSQETTVPNLWGEGERPTGDKAEGPTGGNHCWFQVRPAVEWGGQESGHTRLEE